MTWLSLLEAPLRDFDVTQSASWFCSSEKLTEAGGFRVVICKTFFVKMKLPMSSPVYTEIVVLRSITFRSLLCSNYSFTH